MFGKSGEVRQSGKERKRKNCAIGQSTETPPPPLDAVLSFDNSAVVLTTVKELKYYNASSALVHSRRGGQA